MAETSEYPPLRHSPQRHALLHDIHARTGTGHGWVRTRNPSKTDPASGLPDFLYTNQDPELRPSPQLKIAVRKLDLHGLLAATPADNGHEALDLSPLGLKTLTTWNAAHGEPDTQ